MESKSITKEAKIKQKEDRIRLTEEVAVKYSITHELARMIGGMFKDYSCEKKTYNYN